MSENRTLLNKDGTVPSRSYKEIATDPKAGSPLTSALIYVAEKTGLTGKTRKAAKSAETTIEEIDGLKIIVRKDDDD
jgi:hypothetical protein